MANTPVNRGGRVDPPEPEDYAPPPRQRRGGSQRMGLGEAVAKSFIRSIASSLGRILVRTITGGRR